jgi:protocatechuate 3,4-dioxygenase beta subunit
MTRGTTAWALAAAVAALLAACGGDDEGDRGTTAAGPRPATTTTAPSSASARSGSCEPTSADQLGPFYEPGAPVRARVGDGYVLSGTVRDTRCRPLPGARIEFWLVNPQGEYDDAHRATVRADATGHYRFQSNRPVSYGGRPAHIHVRLSAPGHAVLVTQHYPREGQNTATFDLVPER